MSETIEGVYRDGKIELSRQPSRSSGSRVLVTFLEPVAEDAPLPPGPDREAAIADLIAMMNKGARIAGPYPTRETIYDRDNGGESGDR